MCRQRDLHGQHGQQVQAGVSNTGILRVLSRQGAQYPTIATPSPCIHQLECTTFQWRGSGKRAYNAWVRVQGSDGGVQVGAESAHLAGGGAGALASQQAVHLTPPLPPGALPGLAGPPTAAAQQIGCGNPTRPIALHCACDLQTWKIPTGMI